MLGEEEIKVWIESGLKGAKATVMGDGHHFEATVISSDFSEKNVVERHRMVYAALGDHMKSDIHALSLKVYTPEEYEQR